MEYRYDVDRKSTESMLRLSIPSTRLVSIYMGSVFFIGRNEVMALTMEETREYVIRNGLSWDNWSEKEKYWHYWYWNIESSKDEEERGVLRGEFFYFLRDHYLVKNAPDELFENLWHLYFNTGSVLTDEQLALAARISVRELEQIVWADSYVKCIECGDLYDGFRIPEKNVRAHFRNLSKTFVCDNCQKKNSPKFDYAEYLKGEHWQEVRKAALKRAGYRCQLCNAQALLQVHHRTYERLGHELATDVIALCAGCHEVFHENRELEQP